MLNQREERHVDINTNINKIFYVINMVNKSLNKTEKI